MTQTESHPVKESCGRCGGTNIVTAYDWVPGIGREAYRKCYACGRRVQDGQPPSSRTETSNSEPSTSNCTSSAPIQEENMANRKCSECHKKYEVMDGMCSTCFAKVHKMTVPEYRRRLKAGQTKEQILEHPATGTRGKHRKPVNPESAVRGKSSLADVAKHMIDPEKERSAGKITDEQGFTTRAGLDPVLQNIDHRDYIESEKLSARTNAIRLLTDMGNLPISEAILVDFYHRTDLLDFVNEKAKQDLRTPALEILYLISEACARSPEPSTLKPEPSVRD